MDQAQVESVVRMTARLSAAAFALALIAFSLRRANRPRPGLHLHLFVAFVLAHTVHFSAVMWLAAVTAGENIRSRGGWLVVLAAAALFYSAAFAILRAWISLFARRTPSVATWWTAHAGVVLIALIFLNSFVARADRVPAYWAPALFTIAAVVTYFARAYVKGSLVRASPVVSN
jgi:FtsH-binding integral membrane protein